MKRVTFIGLAIIAGALTGCETYQEYMANSFAGQVGCPANEIHILSDNQSITHATFRIECRGKTFICTSSKIQPYPKTCQREIPR